MDKDKFEAVLPVLITHLISKIISIDNIPQETAIKNLYNSRLYEMLQSEESKVWYYSTEKLYEIYRKELDFGILCLPEY